MNGRCAMVLGLVLASCSVGDDNGGMGPLSNASFGGPMGDPGSGDAEGETGDAGQSGSTGGGAEDASTTSAADEGSVGDWATTGIDEMPAGHCNPLSAQACPAQQVCILVQELLFKCVADASGPNGAAGDACEFANVCDPGLLCSHGFAVACPEGAENCCTPYCDVNGPPTQCGTASCMPFFPDDNPFPWLEGLGYCDGV